MSTTLNRFADCHSCLPLHGDTDFHQLRRHYNAGVRYVSVNVGMDMNPISQIFPVIAGFRRQIAENDWLIQAETYADITRAFAEDKLAVSFDLEGALPLLENPDMVALYHQLGVRQIHLAYNRNNSIAGGAHDIPQGLTPLGETIVHAIHQNGILMDLSHNSEQTAFDICQVSDGHPVLYSHANPRAIVEHGRNISDAIITAVGKTDGLVAVNGVGKFVGDPALNPQSLIPMIEHVASLIGVEKTAIGLDYCYDDGRPDIPETVDRNYWWPVSAGYIPGHGLSGKYIAPESFIAIAEALAQLNYTDSQINAILKENILNLIQRVWR
ncbi:dipeptidase [Suttonella ornithocola]|uniref:Membrane dipeptidase (Peptidase family M19) n=1 Tax=Suttonella ornithocola TaxID=279832 RepID=A0A380MP52_9GAMM|nr:membrane dipeptidase [Suttonella ornithocola]SUO93954.1 Membrane dipeptidase (Peptidase family M19) [Suttonella ornithocola]